MDCPQTIISIAEERLKEGECLLANSLFSGSFYITGYAVELLLKARICKTIGVDGFFDNPIALSSLVNREAYKPFKVHNVSQLLVLSGIYPAHIHELTISPEFCAAWSLIVEWNESHRYLTNKTQTQAQDLLTSVKLFQEWITNHL